MLPKTIASLLFLSCLSPVYAAELDDALNKTAPHAVYSVQVVSFLSKEKAVNYMANLQDVWHAAYVLMIYDKKHRPWYSVHVGNFLAQSAAQAKAEEFRVRSKQKAVVFATNSVQFSRFMERMSKENQGATYIKPQTVAELKSDEENTSQDEQSIPEDQPGDMGMEEHEEQSAEMLGLGENEPEIKQQSNMEEYGWLTGGDGNKYILAGVGLSRLSLSGSDLDSSFGALGYRTSSSIKQNNIGWKLVGGYKFSQYIGVEGGYVNLGEVESNITMFDQSLQAAMPTVINETPVSIQGGVLEAVGYWPINKKCSLLGKGGGYVWQGKTDITTSLGENIAHKENGTNVVLGVGGQCMIGQSNALRIEWERFFLNDDTDLISGGLAVMF